MKTRTIAATAIALLLVSGVAAVAFAHSGHSFFGLGNGQSQKAGTHGSDDEGNQTSENDDNETENEGGQFNLTVGTVLTFQNLTGHFNNLTSEDSEEGDDNSAAGNATGTFTFTVTSASDDGFNLSITSGSFTLNGTTYTVTGGNLTLNEGGESGDGTGTASGGATFTIHVAGISGNSTSNATVGAIKLDVKVGTSDLQVILGSEGVSEDSSDDSGD